MTREICYYAERPWERETATVDGRTTVWVRTDIERLEDSEEGGERWKAVEWSCQVSANGFHITDDFVSKMIEKATEEAAAAARAQRDKLLSLSDACMALDRLGLAAPSGATFTAWLSFLRALGDVLTGAWARYRQALRDLPQQPGFPFDIRWPEKP